MREINWMAGGPQGSGVDLGANVFGRACCYGGLHVYGKREYHSNIKGMHSYFHLRLSDREVAANVNEVDVLAAFDAETVIRHLSEVTLGGGIIVDSGQIDTRVADIPTIQDEFKEEFQGFLDSKKLGDSLSDLLVWAEGAGIKVFKIPFVQLAGEIAGQLRTDVSSVVRMKNVIVSGVSFALLGYDQRHVERAIMNTFADRPKIADSNVLALRESVRFVEEAFPSGLGLKLETLDASEERLFVQGFQAVALGKVLGGCRVQTYYPITPAADESEFLESHEIFKTRDGSDGSVIVIQTEDEIAAITMASGATLAGARASTSTSGPGFSLMVEGLSWAGNNEVPVVVTYYQRGAPSTGLPTRHGQDDLRFALHAGHGEFPRVILASGDIRECFYDAVKAFNYAERYQLPVIHLVDKALANSSQTYPLFDLNQVKIQRGDIAVRGESGDARYLRFKFTESGVSPRALLGTEGIVQWLTGDEHNEHGSISEDPKNRTRMVEKRMKKLDTIDREAPSEDRFSYFGDEEAENLIVSWGSTKGAITEAIRTLKESGFSVGFLQFRMLHPLPVQQVGDVLRLAQRVIDVEMNYSGQLGGMIREKIGVPMDYQILKYNGRPMTVTEVYSAVEDVLLEKAPLRRVLTYGA